MRRGRSAFACVQTEGGLLPSDLLERIAAGDKVVPGLNVTDYHLVGTETFGEAVSRAWSRLVAAWKAFAEAAAKLPDSDLGTAVTRERWLLPLFQELGYGRLTIAKAVELERRTFAISHFWKNSPIHTLGFRIGLDQRQKGVAGAAMASPHGLVQDFLNRSDDHLWAFVTNGYVLRILRDNRSLTRQAYVEFDLQAIMEGAQYAEFALLWMICHESRVEADKPEECWLEKWFQLSKDEGVRALDKLRASVKVAIEQLGSGLLRHRANVELRDALARGDLAAQDYYRQLLRLVYRLIFLFAAEERGALLDPAAPEVARKRYLDWYSTLRLRRLAERRRGGPHPDLWQGLKLVMARLREGCPELGLPALGSFLWTDEAAPWPLRSEIANEDLLAAVRALCATRDAGVTQTVNWRLVGAAELGSIYESLLELHPRIEKEAARFELGTAAGHERKTTGSYYTPSSLVDCLLDSALDPVLAEAAKKPEPEQAILDLKVCDPACGSGHFLVAAARRIARRLAQVRSGDEEPSPTAMQHALRDVVGKCLFGVDLNPMAVELCKVSLWMEALEPGRPLSFLDGHIQCGNSLLGATPALLRKGIPDEAFDAIEGDDKKIASALKKRNKQERKGQTALLFDRVAEEPARYDVIAGRAVTVEQKDDASIETLRCKERLWKGLVESGEYRHAAFLADAWCAAFVWPKVAEHQEAAITEDLWQRMKAGPDKVPARTREIVERLKVEYHFFHWHLAFPQVFRGEENEGTGWGGGFDCVLGNPPWEHVEIMEEEFFATTRPDISGAANAAARKKAIARLEEEDPQLFADFLSAQRGVDAETHLLRSTGRFPLCARGRINTYAVFAELNQSLISSAGQVGCILPSGIATDDTTKLFFQDLIGKNSLRSLYHFENEDRIFPGVHHAFRFVLLTVGYDRRNSPADLVFFARQVAQLADDERHFSLLPDEFDLLNPNTGTCPMFRWRRDAEIAKTIYRRVPVLVRESRDDEPEVNLWRVSFRQGIFNMASDSGLFRTREQLEENGWTLSGNIFVHGDEKYLPLYEAKMVHHFNHCFGTYEGQTEAQGNQGKLPEATPEQHADPTFVALPYYWVPEREVEDPLAGRWDRSWLLGWRDICRSTDQRTVIAAVIRRAGVGNKLPLFLSDKEPASLYANL
ncbi:MAG: N-6 DNA methylase [Proteobacteria bacterium]|jgi:hypothetical protein|nr:N-6 DNA methylase [Pseudomonadota bacterium]